MKAVFRFVLLTLVLLIVALVSALTAMRFAIHGREAAVPNLVDATPMEARRIAESNGFLLEVERQYYSAKVPVGRILSQLPPAGTQVRRGWQIRVAESLGPQRVQIPDVLGESDRAAEMNIRRRGLDIGAVAQIAEPGAAADQVIAQSPPPNASGISAPKISLLISEPAAPQAFVMPNFVGQPLGSMTAALQAAGMRLGSVTVPPQNSPASGSPGTTPATPAAPSSPTPTSIVASQNPAAGSKIQAGTVITLEVR